MNVFHPSLPNQRLAIHLSQGTIKGTHNSRAKSGLCNCCSQWPHFLVKNWGLGLERTFLRPHILEVTEVGPNQQLLRTGQAFFPLFLGCLTFVTSSKKPSCTWGKRFLILKVHFVILFFTLCISSANSYFMNWSTSKGFSSVLHRGDFQIPLPSFIFFLNYRVPFWSVYYISPNLPIAIFISVHGIFPTPVTQAYDCRILFNLLFYLLRPFWAPSAVFLIFISSISFAFFLLLPGTHYLFSGCPPTNSLQFFQMNLSKAYLCIHFNQLFISISSNCAPGKPHELWDLNCA